MCAINQLEPTMRPTTSTNVKNTMVYMYIIIILFIYVNALSYLDMKLFIEFFTSSLMYKFIGLMISKV